MEIYNTLRKIPFSVHVEMEIQKSSRVTSWPCPFCAKRFSNETDLSRHFDSVDECVIDDLQNDPFESTKNNTTFDEKEKKKKKKKSLRDNIDTFLIKSNLNRNDEEKRIRKRKKSISQNNKSENRTKKQKKKKRLSMSRVLQSRDNEIQPSKKKQTTIATFFVPHPSSSETSDEIEEIDEIGQDIEEKETSPPTLQQPTQKKKENTLLKFVVPRKRSRSNREPCLFQLIRTRQIHGGIQHRRVLKKRVRSIVTSKLQPVKMELNTRSRVCEETTYEFESSSRSRRSSNNIWNTNSHHVENNNHNNEIQQRQPREMFGQTQNVVHEMEFDEMGVLLATVSRNGAIRVYDFDEFDLNRMMSSKKNDEKDSIQPVLDFWTRKDANSLRWNPSNQAELAVSYRSHSAVHIYNLETNRKRKILINNNNKQSGIGCECLEFVPNRSNVFVATDIKGKTQLLDTRSKKPQWSFLQPGCRHMCLHESGDLMFCASTGGKVAAYDLRRLYVPAFSSQGVPQEIQRFSFQGQDVLTMRMHSTVPSELICVTPERLQRPIFGDIYILDTIRNEKTYIKNGTRLEDAISRIEMFGEDKLITSFNSILRIQDYRHHGWRGDSHMCHHRDIAFSTRITSFAVNPTSENYVVVGNWDNGARSSDLCVLGLGKHVASDDDDDDDDNGDDDEGADEKVGEGVEIEDISSSIERQNRFIPSSFPRNSWSRFGVS